MAVPFLTILMLSVMGNLASGLGAKRGGEQTQGTPQIMLVTGPVKASKENSVLSKPILSVAEAETHYPFFISFSSPISEEARARVESILGTELKVYIPHNTFMVWASLRAAREAAEVNGVAWVGIVEPKHKIAPSIAALSKEKKDEAVDLIVSLAPTTAPSAAQLRAMATGEVERKQRGSVGHDVQEVVNRLTTALASLGLKTPATARVAGSERLVVQTIAAEAQRVAELLAEQREVSWIEPRTKIVPLKASSAASAGSRHSDPHREVHNGKVVIKGIPDVKPALI